MKEKGFTLIEVLMASAISLIVIYSMATMSVNFGRQARSMSLTVEFASFIQNVMLTTFKETSCTQALRGQSFLVSSPTNITYQEPGGAQYRAGTIANGLEYLQVQIVPIASVTGHIDEYFAQLRFEVAKTGDVIGSRHMTKSLPIKIQVISNQVFQCVP